ncbi:hypothetical protein GCM10010399_87230 [Dactylosporangium fulvum]|uniref:Uncharacterized protein n=1 Tax=Dactylosporangium fulvum TaxID=53359 RepID=A0ABY5W4H7_9ACTN|nr:hypothetical protein [Dactylosporangium fulvum]UWP84880.1 hypothetical protein Dfulv_11875 [Dactylosporangium fulvum]
MTATARPFAGPAGWAAAAGVLVVGLIHARTWDDPDPWGKRTARARRTAGA